jgi:FKBP-type peptidyl-prolyl cis-trans isomerase SlyD
LQLEPQDAFGEYDPDLVKVEARGRFPEPLEVGMQFEGTPEDGEDELDSLIYTVTDVAEDKVVLDGNHPLAGMALRFALNVQEVREATEDEKEHQHAHGLDGLEVLDEDDDEPGKDAGPTLH